MNMDQSLVAALFFATIMIVPVAPFAVWYRNRALQRVAQADRERILIALHRGTVRLWIAWAVALTFLASWIGLDRYPDQSVTSKLPINVAVLVTFHLLVWPFVAPLFNRLERLIAEVEPGVSPARRSIREASLKPRRLHDYLPAYWKGLIAIVALSGLFVIALALLQIGAIETRLVVMAVGSAAFGVFELVLWAFVMRLEVASAATYGGLTQTAAEELRRFRVRGFFWMLVATSALFYACALGSVEVGRGTIPEPNLGLIGGAAGALLGCVGAAFGVAASLKMNRLRHESSQANSPS